MKNIKRKIYSIAIIASLSSTFSLVGGFFVLMQSKSTTSNAISQVSNSLNSETSSATTSTDSYLLPFNQTINNNNNVNFDSPVQYIAFNSDNSSYALLTSSDNTYKSFATVSNSANTTTQTVGFDTLTNYKVSDVTDSSKTNWVKKASELKLNNAGEDTTNNNKFLAVSYMKNISSEYYLAIVNSNSKKYLVELKASDGSEVKSFELTSSSSKATESSESNNTSKFYIDVYSSLNSKFNVYEVNTNSSLTLNLYSFSSTSSSDSVNSISSSLININSDLIKNYFYKNQTESSFSSKLINTYYDNSYVYFVFQNSSSTITGAINNFITVLRINRNSPENNITSQQLHSFNLTEDNVKSLQSSTTKDNSATNVSVSVAGNGSSRTMIISSSSSSNYLFSTLTNDIFNSSTASTFSVLKSPESAFIVSVYSLYSTSENSSSPNTQGYVALLSNNKAIEISSDFSSSSLLYDFKKLNANNGDSKQIFNIFTIPGNANWYAQMTDGSIIQFNGSNLIGQLGSNSILNRTEFLAKTSILSESQIPSTVLFQKVTDDNTSASTTFKTYINSNITSFLKTDSSDTAFGSPLYSAEVSNVTKNSSNNYSVSISFYQELREIKSGNIDSNNKTKVYIGTQQYTFVNSNLEVTVKKKANVSASITNLLPSKVTKEQVLEILSIENAGNYIMSLDPNDSEGTLTVKIKCDAAWVNGSLQYNYTYTTTIGTKDEPFFMVDLFNGLSSSIDLVTQNYIDDTNNATLKTKLTNKYSGTLPTDVTAQNIIDDFMIFGSAFSNNQLISSGIISKPTANNVQLYPSDSGGYLYVVVTIPKIGASTNVTYAFTTPSIFKKNFTTNEEIYFNFLDNSQVLDTSYKPSDTAATSTKLREMLPSTIVGLINLNKSFLFYFINMSSYVYNLISNTDTNNQDVVTLTTAPSDALGTLQITIKINQAIEGLNSEYSYTFTGFATSNSNQSGAPSVMPTFSWGSIDPNAFNGKKPSEITSTMLENDYSSLFNYNTTANQLSKKITVTPMNASGYILVTITFYDWWMEQNVDGVKSNVKVPEKTFSTFLKNGLISVPDSVDSVIWRSFSELNTLNAAYTNSTASNALTLINSAASTDYDKLNILANMSDSFKSSLQQAIAENAGALSLSLTADDSTGTLSAYATVTIDGTTYNLSNVLSGFDLVGSDYSVSLASETSDVVTSLKTTVPSNLTDEQIGSLITINLGNSLRKKVTSSYDDIKGTLTITVSLYKDGDNTPVASTQKTYSGFATADIHYTGTNFILIGAAIIIPIILLLSPILYIYLFKNKRDVKKLSKVLDKRIDQNIRNKNKNVEVNSVADLLKLDSDKF